MNILVEKIFDCRRLNTGKLLAFGFVCDACDCNCNDDGKTIWSYRTDLGDTGLVMNVTVTLTCGPCGGAKITTAVVDPEINEPYTLHLTSDLGGSFVTIVRLEYERVLREIAEKCFDPDIFKARQSQQLIEYVRATYGDELEFLWPKFSDNAIWRRRDTQKWYAVILTVSRRKLGFDLDEIVEIIDLRCDPKELPALLDGKRYLPGWHMNKKSWYTIVLDGAITTSEICDRIDASYKLAVK